MRISFLFLLLNALFFTQILSAVDDDTQLKSALLKAIEAEDTSKVKELADGGHESIDRDDVLQEKIYLYLEGEEERVRLAKERAKSDAAAAKKAAEDKAKADVEAKKQAEAKAKADAVAAKKAAEDKAKADAAAKKQAEAKAKADALATKPVDEQAKADALAKKKAQEKAKADAAQKAADEKAQEDAAAKAREKASSEALAAKKAADEKKRQAAAAAKEQAAVKKTPEVKVPPKAVIVAPVVAPVVVPAAASVKAEESVSRPLSISDKKLIGTWKEIGSDKVNTLVVNNDSRFMLEEVEDDGTLTLTGAWESDKNIFTLNIKKVQRNVHSRETNINRSYTVEELNEHRLVLRDQRGRIAYDLKR